MLVIPTKVGKGATVIFRRWSMQKDAIAQPFTSAGISHSTGSKVRSTGGGIRKLKMKRSANSARTDGNAFILALLPASNATDNPAAAKKCRFQESPDPPLGFIDCSSVFWMQS